jgi:hypothetical protein
MFSLRALLVASVVSAGAGANNGSHPTDPTSKGTWQFYSSLIDTVLALPPDDLRNLQISQAYSELSPLFQGLAHSGDGANWPTIATWASSTVGMGIRKTMLPHWIEIVSRTWPKWLREVALVSTDVADLVCNKLLEHVSRSLSDGNALVFKEIGGSFTRFGLYFAEQSAIGPDPKLLAQFVGTLDPSTQQLLIQAFTLYYRSMWEPSNRTQLLYYANALVGLDEQMRLQPALNGAFLANYTIEVLGRNVTLHVESLMTLIFEALLMPNEILWVREDVPKRAWDGLTWAPGLEHLTLPGLNSLYRRFVPTDDSLAHTGARNWVRLADRMRYVWPMFRGRQDGPHNNCGPFSHAQVGRIWAGQVPREREICLPYNVTKCCAAS